MTGWKKRFHGDLLQKTYQQYADLYGESKRSIKAALDRLEELGVIKKVFRDVPCENGIVMYNLMYIVLDSEILRQLTYPEEISATATENCSEVAKERTCEITQGVVQNFVGGGTTECNTLPQSNVPGGTAICRTNTENTTETTYRDSIYPIHQGSEMLKSGMDMMEKIMHYKKVIKDNISYNVLTHDRSDQIAQIDEIIDLLIETVSVPKEKVRLNGTEYPYQLVKDKLLKLDYFHVCYALDCLKDNTTAVKNIRAYLLTTLYNAASTIESHYQSKVNHDLYG